MIVNYILTIGCTAIMIWSGRTKDQTAKIFGATPFQYSVFSFCITILGILQIKGYIS